MTPAPATGTACTTWPRAVLPKLVVGTPPVRLWLYFDRERILIQVWDGNDQMPARKDADPRAESGRGLLIVESLATDWGASRLAGSSGKIVWAVVAQLGSA